MDLICLWWPFLLLGLPFLITVTTRYLLPLWRKDLRERRYARAIQQLRAHGKTTDAVILGVVPGERVHRAPRPITMRRDPLPLRAQDQPRYEEYFTPDDGQEWLVTLKIRMSYLAEIEVRKPFVLSRAQYMRMVPGKTIDVLLDPADPQTVEILWP